MKDRLGNPANLGSSVDVVNIDSIKAQRAFNNGAAEQTFQVRPGTYFLSSFVRTPDPTYLTPGTRRLHRLLRSTGGQDHRQHDRRLRRDQGAPALGQDGPAQRGQGDPSSRSPAPGTTRGSTPAPSAPARRRPPCMPTCRATPSRAPGSSVTGRVATRPRWSPCRSSAARCCTRSRRRTRRRASTVSAPPASSTAAPARSSTPPAWVARSCSSRSAPTASPRRWSTGPARPVPRRCSPTLRLPASGCP